MAVKFILVNYSTGVETLYGQFSNALEIKSRVKDVDDMTVREGMRPAPVAHRNDFCIFTRIATACCTSECVSLVQ